MARSDSPVFDGRPHDEKKSVTDAALQFFTLDCAPFATAPDEAFFFSNAAIRETYRELLRALCERPGIVLLTGEAGVGKSVMLRRLSGELRAAGHVVVTRYRAGLDFDVLLRVVAEEMKVVLGAGSRADRLRQLHDVVERDERPAPIIVIDDAERLGGDVVLNLFRLAAGAAPRLLLAGRPRLTARVALPACADLYRLLSLQRRLEPLNDEDVASYVFHRLRRAGRRGAPLFAPAALDAVMSRASGLPRRIDELCARSLTLAAASGREIVTSDIVEAAEEAPSASASAQRASPRDAAPRRWRPALTAALCMSLVAGGIALNASVGREHSLEDRRQVPGGSSAGEKGMTLRPAEAPTGVVWTTDEVGQWRERSPPPVHDAFLQSASPSPLERIAAEARTAVYEASPGAAAEACHEAGGTASCDAPVTAASGGEIVLADGISTPPPKPEAARDGTVAALLPSSSQSEVAMDHVAAPQGPDASRMRHAEPASGAAAAQDAGPLPRPVSLALQAGARNALAAGNPSEADWLLTLAARAEMPGEDDDAVEGGAPPVEHEFGRESVGADPTGTTPAVGVGAMMPAQYRVDGGAVVEQTAPEPPAVSPEPTDAPVTSSEAPSPSELLAAQLAMAPSAAEISPPAPAAEDSTVRNSAETVGAVQGRGSDVAKSSEARSPAPQARPPTATSAQAAATPPELVTALLNRGEEMVKLRDISGARLAYERAAAGGSVEAMTALGKTYDAVFLDAINAIGLRADAALATAWYRKAAELGDAEAASRIRQMPPAAP